MHEGRRAKRARKPIRFARQATWRSSAVRVRVKPVAIRIDRFAREGLRAPTRPCGYSIYRPTWAAKAPSTLPSRALQRLLTARAAAWPSLFLAPFPSLGIKKRKALLDQNRHATRANAKREGETPHECALYGSSPAICQSWSNGAKTKSAERLSSRASSLFVCLLAMQRICWARPRRLPWARRPLQLRRPCRPLPLRHPWRRSFRP